MSTKPISEIAEETVDAFSFFDDWQEKYAYIIDIGNSMPPLDPAFQREEFEVKGCQSKVWLAAELNDGKVHYFANSDAVITKGIIGLLISVLDDHSPEEILAYDMKFIDDIGLSQHLSPNRANGLASMIQKMKNYASIHQAHKA
jgi:cysteine desulfuration protein SufE